MRIYARFWEIWFLRDEEAVQLARVRAVSFVEACRTLCAGTNRWNEVDRSIDGLRVYPTAQACKRGNHGTFC